MPRKLAEGGAARQELVPSLASGSPTPPRESVHLNELDPLARQFLECFSFHNTLDAYFTDHTFVVVVDRPENKTIPTLEQNSNPILLGFGVLDGPSCAQLAGHSRRLESVSCRYMVKECGAACIQLLSIALEFNEAHFMPSHAEAVVLRARRYLQCGVRQPRGWRRVLQEAGRYII